MDDDHIDKGEQDQDQDEAEIINGDEQDQLQLLPPRTYDCIFCKRGFTTAQALGGHMNIHRKERAKAKPITKNNNYPIISKQTSTPESNHLLPNLISSSPPSRYYMFMDSNSSSYKLPSTGLITPLTFHTALQMSFTSNFGRVHGKTKKKMDEDDDHELDLELRLGYN